MIQPAVLTRAPLEALSSRVFDLLIIGGGIIGCGVARDAALRGLSVALVERSDFGSGTTSRSTRLIHGGLRYLELFDFELVRADMREREILLRTAPHLVKPLSFLVPIYRFRLYNRLRLRAGMLLYDLLSYDKSLPPHRLLSREATLEAEPALDPDGLQGASHYYDAQVAFPERLALENVLEAAALGAAARSHCQAEHFLVEAGRVRGAAVRDTLTGQSVEIRARLTINATGPWLDRQLADLGQGWSSLLRTTRGAHIVTRQISQHAVVLFARSDRRLFFVVPWFGLSLIGTTDIDDDEAPERARASGEEVAYLLEAAQRAFPGLRAIRPLYGMAGIRALVRQEGVRAGQVSRKHAIREHVRSGGPAGLISVVGGKITAYRQIAAETVDVAARALGRRKAACSTGRRPLPGAKLGNAESVADALIGSYPQGALDDSQRASLAERYGSRALDVLTLVEQNSSLGRRLCRGSPFILAEVVYAARAEAAVTLSDVLLRRVPIGLTACQGLDCAETAAAWLRSELGWSEAQTREQVEAYTAEIGDLYGIG